MSGDEIRDKSWPEYRQLVLAELERIDRNLSLLNAKIDSDRRSDAEEISKMKVAIAMLQVKSGALGAIAGLAVAIAAYLVRH